MNRLNPRDERLDTGMDAPAAGHDDVTGYDDDVTGYHDDAAGNGSEARYDGTGARDTEAGYTGAPDETTLPRRSGQATPGATAAGADLYGTRAEQMPSQSESGPAAEGGYGRGSLGDPVPAAGDPLAGGRDPVTGGTEPLAGNVPGEPGDRYSTDGYTTGGYTADGYTTDGYATGAMGDAAVDGANTAMSDGTVAGLDTDAAGGAATAMSEGAASGYNTSMSDGRTADGGMAAGYGTGYDTAMPATGYDTAMPGTGTAGTGAAMGTAGAGAGAATDPERFDAWNRPAQAGWAADQEVVGYHVEASDGRIGKIDEASTSVDASYLVVDTGPWIFGKKVVLPAGVIDRVDQDGRTVFVNCAKDQVKNSPEFDATAYNTPEYRDEVGSYYSGASRR